VAFVLVSKLLCLRVRCEAGAMPEASEAGSRTLSRFGVEDEQIYLVIRDTNSELSGVKSLLENRKITQHFL